MEMILVEEHHCQRILQEYQSLVEQSGTDLSKPLAVYFGQFFVKYSPEFKKVQLIATDEGVTFEIVRCESGFNRTIEELIRRVHE